MTLQSTFNKCLKVFLSTTLLKMSNERLVKPVWRSGLSSHLTKRVQQNCEGFRCCQAYLHLTNEPHVAAYPNLKFARPRSQQSEGCLDSEKMWLYFDKTIEFVLDCSHFSSSGSH